MIHIKKAKIVCILLAVILIVSVVNIPFWWLKGKLGEFQEWYPMIGIGLWLIKWLLILGTLLAVFYLFAQIPRLAYEKASLFTLFVLLSWKIGENHPFTRVPMYHSFPDYAYVFYLEDENQQVIPFKPVSKLHAPEVSHLYFSALRDRGIKYGKGQEDSLFVLYELGEEMYSNISWKIDPFETCASLRRTQYQLNDGVLKVTDKILYERCME